MNGVSAELIRTGRLELVPLRVEYAEEMAGVLADPALHVFIGGAPETVEELRGRYRRLVVGCPEPGVSWLNWVIRLREEGCLVGTVQATVVPGGVAEVAWVVGTPWQGRGIAGEAAKGLVRWLGKVPVRAVVAHVHPEHAASAAVAAGAGLVATGEWHEGEMRWRRSMAAEGDV
ncbi:GNAT family N-acetyltransferase [Streptomyces sp. 4F14]|uniref:GNAT family N-acetyltransferase n=1 Tax=Streptomyces sp. 4F14 TaxID=3394380 RepID=UPI003A848596